MTLWTGIPPETAAYPRRLKILKVPRKFNVKPPTQMYKLITYTANVNDHLVHTTDLLVTSAPSACTAVPVIAAVTQ